MEIVPHSRRLAYIGIVLSILLPVIIVEFLYLPLVALPNFHTSVFTVGIAANDSVSYPAFAAFDEDDVFNLQPSQAVCRTIVMLQQTARWNLDPAQRSIRADMCTSRHRINRIVQV